MESFIRRMSSIVKKNSNRSSDAEENEQENNEEDNERQIHFQYMQGRRRSAPDIRRRTIPVDRIPMESNQEVTSFEQINSQWLTPQTSTTVLNRQPFNSTGMLSVFNSLK